MSLEKKGKKSFWQRPEGVTGMLFLGGILAGAGYLFYQFASFLQTQTGLFASLIGLGIITFLAIDSKSRNLIWYVYKSIMRKITGLFIQMDPIGILKSYVDDLKGNLKKMNKQISQLRGQMHKLNEIIFNNNKEIKSNLTLAQQAKQSNNKNVMILKSRKAGRLKESNIKLSDLYRKMEILYRVLTKMYENSQILMEDISDQVEIKEQERKAIEASHSAMKSARSIISGDPDKRAMFDQAMEAIADDVAGKVGEMEQFMDMSANFMSSIDLQNGIFEEEGLKMLEKWENEGISLIMGDEKTDLLLQANDDSDVLDLNQPIPEKVKMENYTIQYDNFFE
ncbi:MAG TPA: hypothetical protein ENK75_01875 [Saprospiraceae bacterium]|nr:hypothetical protein [Saprospiraceae bacterium]